MNDSDMKRGDVSKNFSDVADDLRKAQAEFSVEQRHKYALELVASGAAGVSGAPIHKTLSEYTCEACCQTFSTEGTWSEEDALNELAAMTPQYEAQVGPQAAEDVAVVCDGCFKKMAKTFGWNVPAATE